MQLSKVKRRVIPQALNHTKAAVLIKLRPRSGSDFNSYSISSSKDSTSPCLYFRPETLHGPISWTPFIRPVALMIRRVHISSIRTLFLCAFRTPPLCSSYPFFTKIPECKHGKGRVSCAQAGKCTDFSDIYTSRPLIRVLQETSHEEGLSSKQLFLVNNDLKPVEPARRQWRGRNYVFFWIADSVSILPLDWLSELTEV